MRTRLSLAAVAVALAALLPAGASARGFSHGVASSELRAKSAMVWTRADTPGRVRLQVATDKRLRNTVLNTSLRARAATDNTVQRTVRRLKPGTRYWFRFRRGTARSDRGSFRTAPGPRSRRAVRFAWTGDSDPVLEPGTTNLH